MWSYILIGLVNYLQGEEEITEKHICAFHSTNEAKVICLLLDSVLIVHKVEVTNFEVYVKYLCGQTGD